MLSACRLHQHKVEVPKHLCQCFTLLLCLCTPGSACPLRGGTEKVFQDGKFLRLSESEGVPSVWPTAYMSYGTFLQHLCSQLDSACLEKSCCHLELQMVQAHTALGAVFQYLSAHTAEV